ncbi:DUF1707 domain-containing protein [Nocardioides anomalus]|uniref:DUF1707 domain-containing protein n=1 Tax=Nocardioides anomalus TaxID=2712223 RepID=A0A6G6W8K2_9ACTN|nr:DUF1707 domain-containing protein [Nocardioides anomalus]QIG41554.1 DUF1707 domain-containing protein [Nocardioides anomalus]
MTSPDERASGRARDDAIKLVDDALRSGRIVQADHDMRVAQLRQALTMQELDLQTRDLQLASAPVTAPPAVSVGAPQTPVPAAPAPAQPQQPWPLVNYGPGSGEAPEIAQLASKGGKAIGGIVALVVLLSIVVPVAGAIIAFVSARDSLPDFGSAGPTDETTYLPGQAPGDGGVNVHTVEGYDAMVDALKDETGASYTFTTAIYPRYAVLEVPTGVNERYESWYWDGETLSRNDSRGSSSEAQVDLSLVDPQTIVDLLTTVRARVEDPTSWYAIVSGVDPTGPTISAYASNDFSETTYVVAHLDGTIVYDSDAAQ